MPEIVVIGSLNMDLVMTLETMPKPGETIHGREFHMMAGGKGANQAFASARLGSSVAMVGCVGMDAFGKTILEGLGTEGVDISFVQMRAEAATGVAVITVDASGQNSIILARGANWLCTPDVVDAARDLIEQAKIVMLQLEIPMETVSYASSLAKDLGKMTILDPAPACSLPPSLLRSVDFLTPNKTEAEMLSGRKIDDVEGARLAATKILGMGARRILVKLGSQGVLQADGNSTEHIHGFQVEVLDTTAAGDAFNAAVAVGLAEGRYLCDIVPLANAVGALTVTRLGAQMAMPSRAEVNGFLGEIYTRSAR